MDEALLKKITPHNMEAESSVIGAVFLDNTVMEQISEILVPEDFYGRQYGLIYEAMLELYNMRKPIDFLTVGERLKEKDAPEEMQSTEFLKDILYAVPTSANAKAYANIVYEKSTLRKLIKTSEEISEDCYAGTDTLETILDSAEKKVYDVVRARNSKEYEPISQIVMRALDRIQMASQVKGNVTGLATGFTDLDRMTAGLQPSDLVIIAARPSMGKTAFALSIADHVVVQKEKAAVIFSLEMSKEQLVNRLFAMEARIDAQKIRSGNLSNQEWIDLGEKAAVIGQSKLIIDDTSGITVSEIRSKCRKYQMEQDIQLVLVDYIQLMSSNSKTDNRQQEISEISRALKGLARELNVPVVVLSQLNRGVDSRSDKRPMISDIRESGAIEQDADVIMFLYRDDYYNPETERKNVTEVIIAKQRNGPVGTIELTWKPEFTKFVNTSKAGAPGAIPVPENFG